MNVALFELAIVVLVASGLGILSQIFGQPTILAYLATGTLIGALDFFHLQNQEIFRVFSDLGIMFLLFLVGLEINYNSVRLVGRASLIVGIGQLVFTILAGLGISFALGFSASEALYLSVALTFSSTIIVVKLLADQKAINSLYGRLSIGFLLVQDFFAICLLMILTGIESGEGVYFGAILFTFIKGVLLFGATLWLGKRLFPPLFDTISRSHELLFLSSLAWVFLFAAVAQRLGFSIEIAGFLSGLALANSSEHFQIAARIRPLRDFFIVIFFVLLGSSMAISNFGGLLLPIILFSLFVLVGNPLIIWILMGIMGYRKRTLFLVGITSAQISEFSLILAVLGVRLGHIRQEALSIITAVGVITITLSTYLILYGDIILRRISWLMKIFERENTMDYANVAATIKKQIVVIGAHRIGQGIIGHISKQQLLVIDFDPEIVARLRKDGYDCLFGDIKDEEILEDARLREAKIVICTSPDFEDNMMLLEYIRAIRGQKPRVVVRGENERDAKVFYKKGADYVLLPHITSGNYLGKAFASDVSGDTLVYLKKKDMALIHS